jgi:predicted GIY-YIG superfamily endonuclease
MSWAVYCLFSTDKKRTYIGATVDIERRLRQHNGEIMGGAKATVGSGLEWKRALHILGFPDEKAALQFEWKWKYFSRKIRAKTPLLRRFLALETLLNSETSTSSAIPFSSYIAPLAVFPEIEEVTLFFQDKSISYGVVL